MAASPTRGGGPRSGNGTAGRIPGCSRAGRSDRVGSRGCGAPGADRRAAARGVFASVACMRNQRGLTPFSTSSSSPSHAYAAKLAHAQLDPSLIDTQDWVGSAGHPRRCHPCLRVGIVPPAGSSPTKRARACLRCWPPGADAVAASSNGASPGPAPGIRAGPPRPYRVGGPGLLFIGQGLGEKFFGVQRAEQGPRSLRVTVPGASPSSARGRTCALPVGVGAVPVVAGPVRLSAVPGRRPRSRLAPTATAQFPW